MMEDLRSPISVPQPPTAEELQSALDIASTVVPKGLAKVDGKLVLNLADTHNKGRMRRWHKLMGHLACRECGRLIRTHTLSDFKSHYTLNVEI